MRECLINTDIFSYYMLAIPHIFTHARNYLQTKEDHHAVGQRNL